MPARSDTGPLAAPVRGWVMNYPREISKDSEACKTLYGPSANGTVRDSEAQVRKVKAGDIIIIPPGVCHG